MDSTLLGAVQAAEQQSAMNQAAKQQRLLAVQQSLERIAAERYNVILQGCMDDPSTNPKRFHSAAKEALEAAVIFGQVAGLLSTSEQSS